MSDFIGSVYTSFLGKKYLELSAQLGNEDARTEVKC